MKILITGSEGFIAKNLISHLCQFEAEVILFNRKSSFNEIKKIIKEIDFIFHFAGVNRPTDKSDFTKINVGFTQKLINLITSEYLKIPILFTQKTSVQKKGLLAP